METTFLGPEKGLALWIACLWMVETYLSECHALI